MHLWLIPFFPLIGFALNGLFGKRLGKGAVSVIALGSVLYSTPIMCWRHGYGDRPVGISRD
jgi:NADH-quinone oxidoreductase subunit L